MNSKHFSSKEISDIKKPVAEFDDRVIIMGANC